MPAVPSEQQIAFHAHGAKQPAALGDMRQAAGDDPLGPQANEPPTVEANVAVENLDQSGKRAEQR